MYRKKILTGLMLSAACLLPFTCTSPSRTEGQVWSWGFGRNGELGLGSETNLSLPHPIKIANFVDIDSRKSLSAGVTKEGKVLTWGKNRNGVLGHLPANLNVLLPREVQFSQRVAQVSCGYQHLCVVTESGEAWVWGLEQKKPKFRSIGTTQSSRGEQSNLPIKINVPNVKQVSCANDYLTLTDDKGRVFVVGDLAVKGVNGTQAKTFDDPVQLDLPPITKVASGINYSLALDEDGRVHVWGNNTYGQLGTGGRNASEPVMLQSLIRERVVDLSAGDNYSGIVTENGDVYTWGFGNEGQLGHGDKSDQFLPRKVSLKEQVKAISCGGAHTAMVTKNGKILLVGRGREGQLGRQQKDQSNSGYALLVREVEQLPKSNILKVACGGNHTLVLLQQLV